MDPESFQKQHTEQSILQTYLLIPSPLSTILPFQAFTTLSSSTTTTNRQTTSNKPPPHLKPLYRSLQNQRNLTIAEVNDNITRECRKSQTLEARLARSIAAEESEATKSKTGPHTVRSTRSKASSNSKRKRQIVDDDDDEHEEEANGLDDQRTRGDTESDQPTENHDRDEEQSRSKHQPQLRSQPRSNPDDHTQSNTKPSQSQSQTQSEIPLDTLINGQHGLIPPSLPKSQHTISTLLNSMSIAINDLETEIAELDESTSEAFNEIKERIGALSDLRYGRFGGGKRGRNGSRGVEGEEEGVEDKVVRELRELERVCGLDHT